MERVREQENMRKKVGDYSLKFNLGIGIKKSSNIRYLHFKVNYEALH